MNSLLPDGKGLSHRQGQQQSLLGLQLTVLFAAQCDASSNVTRSEPPLSKPHPNYPAESRVYRPVPKNCKSVHYLGKGVQ